jgi:hypothetical protein
MSILALAALDAPDPANALGARDTTDGKAAHGDGRIARPDARAARRDPIDPTAKRTLDQSI